jgi:hypothetical protein
MTIHRLDKGEHSIPGVMQLSGVVLANSDLIDKLGVVLFPSIPLRAPIVRFLDRT